MVRYKSLAFVGYSNYKVGDDGNVWSRWLMGPGSRVGDKWRKLKLVRHNAGYSMVTLHDEMGQKLFLTHRLVLLAFVGQCPDGMVCCHNNGDPSDSRLTNIRWDTSSENMIDSVRHGTHVLKVSPQQVWEIREKYASGRYFQKELARQYGVNQSMISKIVRKDAWSHV